MACCLHKNSSPCCPVQTLLFSLTSESHPCTNILAIAIASLYSAFKSHACLLSNPFQNQQRFYTACFDCSIFIKRALTSVFLSRMSIQKRSQSSTRSSHGNLSQGSVTSADNHSADEVEGTAQPCKAKIAERRSNSSIDMQGKRCCFLVVKDLG